MNPVLFGSRSRSLFGIFTPSARPAPGRAVLICPPFFQEGLRSHRAIRRLAELLGGAGLDTLRFDYFGMGDSAGNSTDVTLDSTVEDARVALDELRDLTGADRFEVIGLRAGCHVAAQAAKTMVDAVDRLVLWDPLVAADEDRADAVQRPSSDAGPYVEIDGFVWQRELAMTLSNPPVRLLETSTRNQLIALTSQSAEADALAEAIAAPSIDLAVEYRRAAPSWTNEAEVGLGALPADILDEICAWSR